MHTYATQVGLTLDRRVKRMSENGDRARGESIKHDRTHTVCRDGTADLQAEGSWEVPGTATR